MCVCNCSIHCAQATASLSSQNRASIIPHCGLFLIHACGKNNPRSGAEGRGEMLSGFCSAAQLGPSLQRCQFRETPGGKQGQQKKRQGDLSSNTTQISRVLAYFLHWTGNFPMISFLLLLHTGTCREEFKKPPWGNQKC